MKMENLKEQDKIKTVEDITELKDEKDSSPEDLSINDREYGEKQKARFEAKTAELKEAEVKLKAINKILDLERQVKIQEQEQARIIRERIGLHDSLYSNSNLKRPQAEEERIANLQKDNVEKLAELENAEEEIRLKAESLKSEARQLREDNFKNSKTDMYVQNDLFNRVNSLKQDIEKGQDFM